MTCLLDFEFIYAVIGKWCIEHPVLPDVYGIDDGNLG